jgi:TFIIF-interacting CTD phosphatase-like protein
MFCLITIIMNCLWVILDLDGTLIHSVTFHELCRDNDTFHKLIAFSKTYGSHSIVKLPSQNLTLFKRPNLDLFLKRLFCNPRIRVACWTAGVASYADDVVRAVFGTRYTPHFVLTRRDCSFSHRTQTYRKCLSKLWTTRRFARFGIRSDNVVLLDDTIKRVSRYRMPIREFNFFADNAMHDTELLDALDAMEARARKKSKLIAQAGSAQAVPPTKSVPFRSQPKMKNKQRKVHENESGQCEGLFYSSKISKFKRMNEG